MKFETTLRMKRGPDYFKIKPVDDSDVALFESMMGKRKEGDSSPILATFELPERTRTFDQLKTIWKLVSIIFVSMEGRKGTAEELYSLYLDLLEVYAEKVPNRLHGTLRPVHVSKDDPACTIATAAHFIEGLMIHLSEFCSLPMDAQTEVRGLFTTWAAWRGGLEEDPLDDDIDENLWRLRHPFSEASGKGGTIQRAHIVSRGSDQADIETPWNWIALTVDEHRLQHDAGWEAFAAKYPHLQGRINRARIKAHKLGLVGEIL